MTNRVKWGKFSDCSFSDPIFDSLKIDYPEFSQWFDRKSHIENADVLISKDAEGKIGAFVYLKDNEEEVISLNGSELPQRKRMKIGTLKLSEERQGVRLGEGVMGLSLWQWQKSDAEEIYVTVFPQQKMLIDLLQKFGFKKVGQKKNMKDGHPEEVYLRNKREIDFSDSYKSFPFISPEFEQAGMLPIRDIFHDRLFPHSTLARNRVSVEDSIAGNGITKVYIATPSSQTAYYNGCPVVIYRMHTGSLSKKYNSCVTSFGTITEIKVIKERNQTKYSFDEFYKMAGNKTIFTKDELRAEYSKPNIILIQIAYNGFFGEGNNVNMAQLENAKLWFDEHPYQRKYSKEQFIRMLEMGGMNVKDIIID